LKSHVNSTSVGRTHRRHHAGSIIARLPARPAVPLRSLPRLRPLAQKGQGGAPPPRSFSVRAAMAGND
jgi:hypothetical protein